MHVSLMLIFNECITSGFVAVCIMDNMDLQTKSKNHENIVINMSIINKIVYVLACRNGESPLMFNFTFHLFAMLTLKRYSISMCPHAISSKYILFPLLFFLYIPVK